MYEENYKQLAVWCTLEKQWSVLITNESFQTEVMHTFSLQLLWSLTDVSVIAWEVHVFYYKPQSVK